MNASGTGDRTQVVLDECEAMWAVSNIPKGKTQEMRAELAGHLQEAARDGKPVEDVVGDDVTIFALEWARENGPPRSLKGEVLDWLLALLLTTTLVTVAHHLVTLSASFPFRWYTLAFITVPTLGAGFTISPGVVAALISLKPRWKRELIGFLSLATVIGLPLAVSAFAGAGTGEPIFEWSWSATVLAGVSTVALWILRDDPAVPAYEDVAAEPFVMDRAFVLLAVVMPLSTLAALFASSFEPRLMFALWWGVPGVYALLLPPHGAARWRALGATFLALAALLTTITAVLS